MIEISSATNDHFKRWKDLDSSRGIRKHGEFFLMGEKLIREFLENPKFKIKSEIICEGQTPLSPSYPSAVRFGKVSVFKLPKALFNEIDFVGTHFNLLILEVPEILPFQVAEPKSLELICPLGDPSNLGALARSALAFGARRLILTDESANPFLPKAIKSSAGALLNLDLVRAPKLSELIPQLSEVHALDMEGLDVSTFAWPQNLFLLVGEEGPGLKNLKVRYKLKVPTGPVESLNATVAASIALYSYSQR